jgi:hypothetical protein
MNVSISEAYSTNKEPSQKPAAALEEDDELENLVEVQKLATLCRLNRGTQAGESEQKNVKALDKSNDFNPLAARPPEHNHLHRRNQFSDKIGSRLESVQARIQDIDSDSKNISQFDLSSTYTVDADHHKTNCEFHNCGRLDLFSYVR